MGWHTDARRQDRRLILQRFGSVRRNGRVQSVPQIVYSIWFPSPLWDFGRPTHVLTPERASLLFLFHCCPVQISARKPVIVVDGLRGFPPSQQTSVAWHFETAQNAPFYDITTHYTYSPYTLSCESTNPNLTHWQHRYINSKHNKDTYSPSIGFKSQTSVYITLAV